VTWESRSPRTHRHLIHLRFDSVLPFPPSPPSSRVSFVKKHNMYTTLISAALFSLFAGGAVYADTSPDFSVQTPVFTQVTYRTSMLLDVLISHRRNDGHSVPLLSFPGIRAQHLTTSSSSTRLTRAVKKCEWSAPIALLHFPNCAPTPAPTWATLMALTSRGPSTSLLTGA
jgi:hypothetical protein